MRSIDGLHVLHGVPIVLHKDNSISTCQIEAKSSNRRSHYNNLDGEVIVKLFDDLETLLSTVAASKMSKLDAKWNEHRVNNKLEVALHLAENEGSVLFFTDLLFVTAIN